MGIEEERRRPSTLRDLIAYLADKPAYTEPVDGVTYCLFNGSSLWQFGQPADGILVSDNDNDIINISLEHDKDRSLTEAEQTVIDRLIDGLSASNLDRASTPLRREDSGLGPLIEEYREDLRLSDARLARSDEHRTRMDDFLAQDHTARLMEATKRHKHKGTVAKYISYADLLEAGISLPVQTQDKLRENLKRVNRGELNKSELSYAEALDNYLKGDDRWTKPKEKALNGLANKIRSDLRLRMATLGLSLNPYSESLSWAYWDIGKQAHLSNHPDESTAEYSLGNPFQNARVVEEIVCRHLGWELHQNWRIPASKAIIETAIAHNRHKQEIEALLNKEGKPENGTLSSHELMHLGEMVSAS